MSSVPEEMSGNPELRQALMLFGEMNVTAGHVATLVDGMIRMVRNGEISTNDGLSFLEMKYNMLLSYLINLTYIVLRKCSSEKIESDPCVDRLIEIQVVLDKIRPIDQKLKYQIDKLVKMATVGTDGNDPSLFKPNPENLIGNLDESSGEESDITEKKKEKSKSGLYVPPKLSAQHYSDDKVQDRNKHAHAKNKRLASSIIQDLREEYLDTPVEVTQGSRAQHVISKQQQEKEEYEEQYLTRLPVTKAEKHASQRLTTVGTLGDEVTNFGASSSRKRKHFSKSKSKKGFKRKRLN